MKALEQIKNSKRIIVSSNTSDGGCGEIHMPTWTGSVVWSYGGGWDHVSVSPYKKRIMPSWDDMCMIKDIFFDKEEYAVQYHPPKDLYVNNMPNCLHLFRPQKEKLPVPPTVMVGIRKGQSVESLREELKEIFNE